jgi:hybrid cluster-associated redox disulfide protein
MITKDMLIIEALSAGDRQKIATVLMGYGMRCFGCALAKGETIEQAAASHGVDVDELVGKLNDAIK